MSFFPLHIHIEGERTIPVSARSKAGVLGRSLAGITGSNPAGGHGYLSLVSVVLSGRADNSFRGVLASVVCLSVIVKPR